MGTIEKIVERIEKLERKDFYLYAAISGGIFVLILGFIIFSHYRQMNQLRRKINAVNELREDAQRLLSQYALIERQKQGVNQLLAEEEDFKIGGYMKELLAAHNLTDKTKSEQHSYIDTEGIYRESILNIQLIDMNMQELTQILHDIEQKKRVYIKSLEVSKSKKNAQAIEVNLTVATLQSKEKATE